MSKSDKDKADGATVRELKRHVLQGEVRMPSQVAAAIAAASATPNGDGVSFDEATERLAEVGLLPEAAADVIARPPDAIDWIIQDVLAARGNSKRGFKGDIIGGSKRRKTFFGLQLAACVSAGRDLLGAYRIPKPRKVLYLNFELRNDFSDERVRRIAKQYDADFSNLLILSPTKPYLLRNRYDGAGNYIEGVEDEFVAAVRGFGIELLIADPEYKLLFPDEDENSGQGIGGILRWRDRIITETPASCLFVHHDRKDGGIGADITARGAGSGFGGRDYDVRFALSEHIRTESEPSIEVLECSSRVRPSPADLTIVFDDELWTFGERPDIPPDKKTGKRKGGNSPATQQERADDFKAEQARMADALADIVSAAGGDLLAREDVENRMLENGFAVLKVKGLLKLLCGEGKPYCDQPELDRNSKTGRKHHGRKFYTTHELAAGYRGRFQRLCI